MGDRLGDEVQGHFLRNTAELVSRLRRHKPTWCAQQDGDAIISTINLQTGRSSVHDQVSLFFILNSHLPAAEQFAFVPESGFTDKFLNITELSLASALRGCADSETLKAAIPLLTGTNDQVRRNVAHHPGELTYGLFFDQNLSYSRYSTVIAPNPLLPGLAQRPVLTLQDGDVQQYQVLRDALTGAPTSKERKQELASFLSMHLEKPHERKAAIDRAATPQDDLTTKRLKYVLLGTISTNGLELQCLEYSLVKPKPWRQAIGVPKTTRRKLQSAHSRVSQGFPENQGQYISSASIQGFTGQQQQPSSMQLKTYCKMSLFRKVRTRVLRKNFERDYRQRKQR